MKTRIRITGQISGNYKLLRTVQTNDCEVKKFLNDFVIEFPTIKEAKKGLSEAYQYLKADKEDWNNSLGMYRRGVCLSYDASRAYIES